MRRCPLRTLRLHWGMETTAVVQQQAEATQRVNQGNDSLLLVECVDVCWTTHCLYLLCQN